MQLQARDHRWLGQIAVEAGRLQAQDLPPLNAVTTQDAWAAVAAAAGMDQESLAALVAAHHKLPPARLEGADTTLSARLPGRLVQGLCVVAVRQLDEGVELATAEQPDAEWLRLLEFALETPVHLSVAPPNALLALHTPAHNDGEAAPDAAVGLLDADDNPADAPAVVKLCNQLLRQAVQQGASDIHVQPFGEGGVVRMRIDGVLRRVAALPRAVMQRVISRIKLLGLMDPTDTLRPQDGRLRLLAGGRRLDLRLSTVPTAGAEKLVVRLLGAQPMRTLAETGLGEPERGQLQRLLNRSTGMVLVTGPTGSGKTTTLYSALAERNDPGVHIATVEDPVEIQLPWLTQIEVNPKADLTFANALRSVLRQDPDVVLIGEIRDGETARIAVQAALTGHLVLATLHTRDALSALPRLLDLGISPQLLSESLIGGSAQRLVRRLCPDCAQPDSGGDEMRQWLQAHAGVDRLMKPVGCAACGHTGYKGRLPITQVFELSPDMAALLESGEPMLRLRESATRAGMRTLSHSALDRLRAGETGLDEVLRVLGEDFLREMLPAAEDGAAPGPGLPLRPIDAGSDGPLPVLVVSADPTLRQLTASALADGGFPVLSAGDAAEGRQALERQGAVAGIVLDLSGLRPERVGALMEVRQTLGGAAAPILALTTPNDQAMQDTLRPYPGLVWRERPDDLAELSRLMARVVRALD